mgnify:CR=1 FL=1
MEILKRELELRFDYTPLAAFRSIDRLNLGRVDVKTLCTFLRNCGHKASDMELLAIIRRIDTDGDACLIFEEFAEFLRCDKGTPMR